MDRALTLHLAIIAALALAFFILPAYHAGNLARIMVLAIYAMGYNLAFGYTGLLSLGHALFFGAGMYGLSLSMQHLGTPTLPALAIALACAAVVAGVVGALALRTKGVAFMIVTLMFAQAGYLVALYFSEWTRGEEGFVLPQTMRQIAGIDLTTAMGRYFAALVLFAITLLIIGHIVRAPFGRTLIAIRENEARATMLGYDVQRLKWIALVISGTISGLAGATYALLFGYAGASFAAVPYSILPLLYVLLGGAGTTLGPLIGAAFMIYLFDLSADITDAYMLIAGVVLVLLTMFLPQGILGTLRARRFKWLP
ncbi:branched-chain amino acid ABC transporter permease [Oceaniglobus ichthyenteri]|uniref:branched-chain amino acid ABC transporter permease n=1 Tax=Oceaniglobus ichthyenteri TaxID=2136177 RepID=UPI000D3D09F2|nr:branched-chain amino acid ABC transporter permease [Oceaniglobus ichthyenteri]